MEFNCFLFFVQDGIADLMFAPVVHLRSTTWSDCYIKRRRYDAGNRGETATLPTTKVHPPADETLQVLGAVPRANDFDDPVAEGMFAGNTPTHSDGELVD